MAEYEKKRLAEERKWELIARDMEKEFTNTLLAISRAKSTADVINIVKTAKHRLMRYVEIVRKEIPTYVAYAEGTVNTYLPEIISRGEERVVEIFNMAIGR